MRRRRSGVTAIDGDSSTTFWWRRWIEHSRSTNGRIVPCVIAEQLNLDVARRDDAPLEIDRRVAERRPGLGARGADGGAERSRGRPRCACPCRRRRRRPSRRADSRRSSARRATSASGTRSSSGCSVPGTTGTPARMAASRAAVLLPIERDRFGRRPDERQPRVAARAREAGVLGQEPVAGVHRVRPRPPRGVDDRVDPEVALRPLRLGPM